ncbi:MAG TPA: efflux RND transporter periplasmic adaptor subunit [Chthoniobacterales bacterium]|jgi:HlyD family secretion protein|nr:efflux RND transporter periplasmic adaptor subunit [Chthoniobacterales bacterium]
MHQAAAAPSPTVGRKRRSRRKLYIGLGIAGLVLILVIGSVISGKREQPIPITTEKAARRTIVETVSATGKIQPETEVKISPEVAGEIIELPVVDGKEVKKGELLLKIRPDSYKALLEQQQAAISTAEAVSGQQKAAMEKADQDLAQAKDLFQKKLISQTEMLAAQTSYDAAKSMFESGLHSIEGAKASSSQARDQLSKTTIFSPLDGVVTVLNSKLGERVVATNQFAGTEVMKVADLNHMQAVVDVNENDVVHVKRGDFAQVMIDAYGDRKFKGAVEQIANTGKTTGAGTQEEVTNFEVKIRIDEHEMRLRPGLSCTAEIQTDMVKDVVSVPIQSVTIRTGDTNLSPEEIEQKKKISEAKEKADNNAEVENVRLAKLAEKEEREKLRKVVFLKDGGKAKMVEVTTGIADDANIEIKSGVKPGDEVISGSYSAISRKLKDGARVMMEKAEKK